MTTLRRMTTTTVAQGQLIRGGWHVPPLQTSAPKTVDTESFQNQDLQAGASTQWIFRQGVALREQQGQVLRGISHMPPLQASALGELQAGASNQWIISQGVALW